MFYDMERDDPKEFKRRKNLLTSKKNKVKSSMKTCLCEINKLRATTDGSWPELFDELYIEYSSGRMFGTLNFTEYCEFSVRSDEKYHSVLEEAQRIHSVAWYISMDSLVFGVLPVYDFFSLSFFQFFIVRESISIMA